MGFQVNHITFCNALQVIKQGGRVARTGWYGKGMWIEMRRPVSEEMFTLPYIYLKTQDGEIVPWLPSQTDLLTDDWMAVT